MLETWAAPLTGGRIAVALLNRSPAPDTVTARWADIGAPAGARFSVREIWAATDHGSFVDSFSIVVGNQAVALLVLTPM